MSYDIFVCVETWLSDENIKEIPLFSGFNCYWKNRDYAMGGGIVIYIRKKFEFSEIVNITSPH